MSAAVGAPSVRRRAGTGRGVDEGSFYLKLLLLSLVLLQRFAIPFGGSQVPLIIPVGLGIIAVAILRGRMRIDPMRAILVAILWLTALICTLAQVFVGSIPSVLALVLLLVLYLPAMVTAEVGNAVVSSVLRFFVRIMAVAAGIAVAQLVLQYAGLPNIDYIGEYLPQGFVLEGFIPNAPIAYGEELRRSNALIFLEPSFLSLFLGLGVLIAIRGGMNWVWPTVLLAGMVPTLAGNGIVVLLPGIVLLLLTPLRRNLGAILPGVTLAILGAAITPLGALYLGRTGEANSANSSSSFRFVQPYSTLLPASFDDPFHTFFGHGAGSAGSYYSSEGLKLLTQPIIPKVFYEYGLLGAVGIAGTIIVLLLINSKSRLWLFGLVIGFIFVNASLLLATLVIFTFFWLQLMPLREDVSHLAPRGRAFLRAVNRRFARH